MDFEAEIKGYLQYCSRQKRLSGKTTKAYATDLAQFGTHSGAASEASPDKSVVARYIESLHRTFEPRTVKRKLASLRAFFNYLEFEGILADNPLRYMNTRFREPKVLPRAMPLRVIAQILSAAHRERRRADTDYGAFAALRDVAVVEMLFATGMRVSELCSLDVGDVDLNEGNVRIMGKGAKERVIQIGNGDVLALLREYGDTHARRIGEAGCFFVNRLGARVSEQSVRFMLRRFGEKAGVGLHVTPHMFRHSFATLLLEEDVDIRYIQCMLGHSSIRTTQIYTQVTTEKQRQILTAKHPRNRIPVG